MSPSIHLRIPPSWFFKFPPDDQPLALPPPTDARTFASPFGIDTSIYNAALDWKVPVTIATLYAITAIVWNRINRQRGYKPYAFSQTSVFKTFVIAHNVFLAVFSAFTFFGMLRALAHTWPGREHHLFGKYWPGMRAEYSVAGAADALCKMHGPRGFGQFASYQPDGGIWKAHSPSTRLLNELPDGSDVGRLWNEGLAFWGWWFYLSKFYEVFDTFIILAKGKRSSTLQTYHHTGAMMCMWAGIRYMSPPIWMFCFLNSGIHTMMYIYYTLSALGIRINQRIKRSLTTMQISQFLIGITFAALHLFVTYDIPITKAEAVSKTLDQMASSAMAGISSAAATASSAGIAAWLKQAALRAAGEEGLAENVLAPPASVVARRAQQAYQSQQANAPASQNQQSTYTTGYETVPCIDTSGQSFAVWLNLVYLFPLTILFTRFFIKSYTRRGRAKNEPKRDQALKAIKDAAHGTDQKFEKLGKAAEDAVGDINGKIREINDKTATNGTPRSRKVSDTINKQWSKFEKGADELSEAAKEQGSKLQKKVSQGTDKLRKMFEDGTVRERSESPSQDRGRARSDSPSNTQDNIKEYADQGKEYANQGKEYANQGKEYAKDVVDKLENTAEESVKKAKQAVGQGPSQGPDSEKSTDGNDRGNGFPPSTDDNSSQGNKKPNELEQSWADVGEDAYPKQEQKKEDRSATPTLDKTRSLSPQKASKLPRPKSREPENRSPEKKKPAKLQQQKGTNAQSSSSLPSPTENKTPASESDDRPTSSGSDVKIPAPSSDADADAESKYSPSKSQKKKAKQAAKKAEVQAEVKQSSLPIAPAAPNNDQERKEQSLSTDDESEQGQDATKTDVEAGSEEEDKLQFKHVDENAEGGEAEVKEGTSFADAVKEE